MNNATNESALKTRHMKYNNTTDTWESAQPTETNWNKRGYAIVIGKLKIISVNGRAYVSEATGERLSRQLNLQKRSEEKHRRGEAAVKIQDNDSARRSTKRTESWESATYHCNIASLSKQKSCNNAQRH